MDNQEQVLNTTIQDPVVGDNKVEVATPESTENSNIVEQPKTYSEEEYNKALQSARSKAKFELLQELNVKNVEDFKAKFNKMSEYETKYSDLQKQVDELNTQISKYKENEFLESVGVNKELKDDFLKLLGNTSKEDMDSKVESLKKNYPQLFKQETKEINKLGSDKSGQQRQSKLKDNLSDAMLKKYPWLNK